MKLFRWLSAEEGDKKTERTLVPKRPGSETYRLRDRTPSAKVRTSVPAPSMYALSFLSVLMMTEDLRIYFGYFLYQIY